MNQELPKNLFRLATVLYADNNYEVSPKKIHKKVVESALLSNGNKSINIHKLIDIIFEKYKLHFDEQEIKNIITLDKHEHFVFNEKNDELKVVLSEKRRAAIEEKVSNKTIDFFINDFIILNPQLAIGIDVKDILYRFLYEVLNTNIESFKKLLDSKKNIEDLINIESHTYNALERQVINEFLAWDNTDKNKAIFDIASYALEYCMISNNGGGSHVQLNNIRNKIFYLDTNVIFRVLGINGGNRQNRTITFLQKFLEANTQIVISKFTENEFKDTVSFYIDKLDRHKHHRKINPAIFEERYFKSLGDMYDFYYKWRAKKINDSLDIFEAHVIALYEKFKNDFKITHDFNIPFDENEEKTERKLNELSINISSFKSNEGAKHGLNGDYNDACNILLVESRRNGKNTNIFDTKQFIISTDQSLRRWDYQRNSVTPIVILPSQWLSILLRYINRTDDDFNSFVSFLNLPTGESQINPEKLHVVLSGISEMTENFEQQRLIVQTLIQKKFDGILEKGIGEEEIIERTKAISKTILESKVEEIEEKHQKLKEQFELHKSTQSKHLSGLQSKSDRQQTELSQKNQEIDLLRNTLKANFISKNLRGWQTMGLSYNIPVVLLIIIFMLFQFICKDLQYNLPYKLVERIDSLTSDTKKNTLRALMYTPIVGLWMLISKYWKRFADTEEKNNKIFELGNQFDDENSSVY